MSTLPRGARDKLLYIVVVTVLVVYAAYVRFMWKVQENHSKSRWVLDY